MVGELALAIQRRKAKCPWFSDGCLHVTLADEVLVLFELMVSEWVFKGYLVSDC
jgi:hypothetical protein